MWVRMSWIKCDVVNCENEPKWMVIFSNGEKEGVAYLCEWHFLQLLRCKDKEGFSLWKFLAGMYKWDDLMEQNIEELSFKWKVLSSNLSREG